MDLNDSLKAEAHVYDQDGLRSVHNHEFMGIALSAERTSGASAPLAATMRANIPLPGADRRARDVVQVAGREEISDLEPLFPGKFTSVATCNWDASYLRDGPTVSVVAARSSRKNFSQRWRGVR
jgi:hypothetical protein